MSETDREVLSKRSASLFAAAKREHMPDDAKAALLSSLALGVGGTAATAAGTGAAGAATQTTQSALRTKLLWILMSAGIVAGSAVAMIAWRAQAASSGASPTATQTAASQTSEPAPLPVPVETQARIGHVESPPLPTIPASPASAPPSARMGPVSAPSTPSAPATADTWESEADALATARGALRAGKTDEALARLDKYFAAFPNGHLQLEARVLRIRAYAKTDPPRARREAEALRKAQPGSAYDDELKALAP